MLRYWLDYHRDGLMVKCGGLSAAQLRERAVPPSNLSLLGLVRHMTVLERVYWRRIFLGDDSVDFLYCDANGEGDFEDVDLADPEHCFTAWREERRFADEIIQAAASLEAVGEGGQSVRFWILKLINEYARHNGHADFLRERIDGKTGE